MQIKYYLCNSFIHTEHLDYITCQSKSVDSQTRSCEDIGRHHDLWCYWGSLERVSNIPSLCTGTDLRCVASVGHFPIWPLPANSLVSSQLFSNNDIILCLVVASQTNILHAGQVRWSIRRYFKQHSSCVSAFKNHVCVWQCGNTNVQSPVDGILQGSAGLAPDAGSCITGNKPRQANKPVWDMRVCATAAQQGCGDSERRIS